MKTKEASYGVQVILGVVPSKSNGYRIFNNRLIKSAALSAYEKAFYMQCSHYRNANIEGYFELHLKVFYANNRSDLDGSLKILMDCMQQVKAIKNDNRAVKIVAEKYIDKANPRVEFLIEPI